MLKLKHQYFGHLMWRANSSEMTLILGKTEGRSRKGGDRGWESWMASLTQWTWVWANSGRQGRTGKPGVLQFMGPQRVRHHWVTGRNDEAKQNKNGQTKGPPVHVTPVYFSTSHSLSAKTPLNHWYIQSFILFYIHPFIHSRDLIQCPRCARYWLRTWNKVMKKTQSLPRFTHKSLQVERCIKGQFQ